MSNNNLILDPELIENFCKSYKSKLSKYKLSYYLRDKNNDRSKENAVHASIIWTRQAVSEINKAKTVNGSKEINDLIILVSYIDILLESTEQVYRALYNKKSFSSEEREEFCFNDVHEEYSKLNNKEYFKEIRALFSAHPVNIKTPSGQYRFADIPKVNRKFFDIANLKGDFNIRLWTATKNDKDTIYFPLYIEDLIKYSKILYKRYEQYSDRLIQIANRKIK